MNEIAGWRRATALMGIAGAVAVGLVGPDAAPAVSGMVYASVDTPVSTPPTGPKVILLATLDTPVSTPPTTGPKLLSF